MARHGAISTDVFEKVLTLDQGGKRGHWRTAAGIRRYERHARLLKMITKLPGHLQKAAEKASENLGRLLLGRNR